MIVHLSANEAKITQIAPKASTWDWSSAILLVLALFFASGRLVATDWTEGLLLLQMLALMAAIFGLAIGQSIFPKWVALLFSTAYGIFFVPWHLTLTILESFTFREDLISLWGRILFSINQLVNRENVEDPILFLLTAGVILWAISIYAGYTLARHQAAWRASLPIGALMVVLHTYDAAVSSRAWYLALYMFFTLLLVARRHLVEQREKWIKGKTQLTMDIGPDMLRATVLAAGVLVMLAWVTPTLASYGNPARAAWDAVMRPWREFRRDFGRALYSLESDSVGVSDYYGESLPLGRGNSLASDIVLSAEVPQSALSPARYYWRDRVYDIYENGGWRSNSDAEERVSPEENELIFPEWLGRSLNSVRITSGRTIGLIHTPTQPVSLSRTADFSYVPIPGGSWDIVALQAPVVIRAGESYQVEASFTTASITELRAAGNDYPEWVVERYLQVPEEISERTLQLAQDLSAGLDTPYDMTSSITQWLRENVDYVDNLAVPPSDFEPIDWMLFEQRQAFCNYYATAEIMMLRSLGIPARLAVGYAEGEEGEGNVLLGAGEENEEIIEGQGLESRFFTVRQSDAHAWPEVFFPGIGWVEFEPTGNQTPLVHRIGSEGNEDDGTLFPTLEERQFGGGVDFGENDEAIIARLAEEEAAAIAENTRRINLIAATLAVVLVVTALVWRRYRMSGGSSIPVLIVRSMERLDIQPPQRVRVWARSSRLEPLSQAYMEINSALRRVGAAPKMGDTPKERATALSAKLPQIAPLVEELSQHYQRSFYKKEAIELRELGRSKWTIRLASIREQIRGWFGQLPETPQKLRQWVIGRKVD